MYNVNPSSYITPWDPMAGFKLPSWGASPNQLGSGIPNVAAGAVSYLA